MPKIGLGTYSSGRQDNRTVANAVRHALNFGFNNIDHAPVYGNEKEIGKVYNNFLNVEK